VFRVYKKKLSNGMNVLVRPNHKIPEVVTQVWYNVGSRAESDGERGMAHLIEHMIFKGTKKLSEIDIDLLSIRLGGYTNAFTSHDTTCYYLKLPSNVWQNALMILSDCMENARFDPEMLKSELQAVIQELKLYRDDYQETLIEKMMAFIFPEHSYGYPIIGFKEDLVNLNRDDLYRFYKKHYHPGNATLVIVGDVTRDEAFDQAEKYFGGIKSGPDVVGLLPQPSFVDDLACTSVRLPRPVENPWAFYAYPIPGLCEGSNYLFDMVKNLVGGARSSRLYERLVNETGLATDAGSFVYDLFEKSLFFIYVQPRNVTSLPRIEEIINEELARVASGSVEDWEFRAVKRRAESIFYSQLESNEHQANLIGNYFLATGNAQYFETYVQEMKKAKRSQLEDGVKKFLRPIFQHKGYLLPSSEQEEREWERLQKESDELDRKILEKFVRTTEVEPPKVVLKAGDKDLPTFKYSVPESFFLDNGLEVVFLNNPGVPKISVALGLKADYSYDPEELSGISSLVGSLFLEGTKRYSATELHRYIDSLGMHVGASSGFFYLDMLEKDFETGIDLLSHIVTMSTFLPDSIEKVKRHQLVELHEYWDSPLSFVESLARRVVYKGHPYAKDRLGYVSCVEKISREQVFQFYEEMVSPRGAILVIVGDLSRYDKDKLTRLLNKSFQDWRGREIPDLVLPEISYGKAQTISHEIKRDQVALALVAPSVSRLDPNFEALSLLDFIFTGAGLSMNSRLFRLREQSGLFYTIGGSLVYGSSRGPGMMFIRTLVSPDKVDIAERLIKNEMKILRERGIGEEELKIAVKGVMSASVRAFERNGSIAEIFLHLKRCGINLDLFDKRGSLLSIMKVGTINDVASRYCKENFLSTILVGRG